MARPVPESVDAHARQIAMLRAAGPTGRFALARSLSATAIELARSAIRQRHPEWSERDVLLEFVRISYGADLAQRVAADLARRDR